MNLLQFFLLNNLNGLAKQFFHFFFILMILRFVFAINATTQLRTSSLFFFPVCGVRCFICFRLPLFQSLSLERIESSLFVVTLLLECFPCGLFPVIILPLVFERIVAQVLLDFLYISVRGGGGEGGECSCLLFLSREQRWWPGPPKELVELVLRHMTKQLALKGPKRKAIVELRRVVSTWKDLME